MSLNLTLLLLYLLFVITLDNHLSSHLLTQSKSKSDYDASNVQYPDNLVKSKLSAFDAGGWISFVLIPFYNEDSKTKVTGVGSNVGLSIHL